MFTEEQHGTILGTLIHLDLDALTRAFRVYCQLKVNNASVRTLLP